MLGTKLSQRSPFQFPWPLQRKPAPVVYRQTLHLDFRRYAARLQRERRNGLPIKRNAVADALRVPFHARIDDLELLLFRHRMNVITLHLWRGSASRGRLERNHL